MSSLPGDSGLTAAWLDPSCAEQTNALSPSPTTRSVPYARDRLLSRSSATSLRNSPAAPSTLMNFSGSCWQAHCRSPATLFGPRSFALKLSSYRLTVSFCFVTADEKCVATGSTTARRSGVRRLPQLTRSVLICMEAGLVSDCE